MKLSDIKGVKWVEKNQFDRHVYEDDSPELNLMEGWDKCVEHLDTIKSHEFDPREYVWIDYTVLANIIFDKIKINAADGEVNLVIFMEDCMSAIAQSKDVLKVKE